MAPRICRCFEGLARNMARRAMTTDQNVKRQAIFGAFRRMDARGVNQGISQNIDIPEHGGRGHMRYAPSAAYGTPELSIYGPSADA